MKTPMIRSPPSPETSTTSPTSVMQNLLSDDRQVKSYLKYQKRERRQHWNGKNDACSTINHQNNAVVGGETLLRVRVIRTSPSFTTRDEQERTRRRRQEQQEPEWDEFCIPVSVMLQREKEMKFAAKVSGLRWSSSRLFRMWREKSHILEQTMKNSNNNEDTPSIGGGEGERREQLVCQKQQRLRDRFQTEITLVVSPEESMKRNCHYNHHRQSRSATFLSTSQRERGVTSILWEPWMTNCIRVYYNTGTIRIPEHSQGCDVLLALEYFSIVTCTPDAFIFDTIETYETVKHWSTYFTYRPTILEWVVQDYFRRTMRMVQERKRATRRREQRSFNSFVHVWVTSPIDEEESVHGIVDLIEAEGEPATVLFGGSSGEDLSCRMVHDIFGGEAGNTNHRSSSSVMRQTQQIEDPTSSIEQRFRYDFCHTVLNGIMKATATNSKVENYNVLDDFVFDISFDVCQVSWTSTRNGQTTFSRRPVLRIETKPKQATSPMSNTQNTKTVGERTRITASRPSASSSRPTKITVTNAAVNAEETSKAGVHGRKYSKDGNKVKGDVSQSNYDPYACDGDGDLPPSAVAASNGFYSVGSNHGRGSRRCAYNDGAEHYQSLLPTTTEDYNINISRRSGYNDGAEHYPGASGIFPHDEIYQDELRAIPEATEFVPPIQFINIDFGDMREGASVLTGPTIDTMSEIGRMMKEDALLHSQIQQMAHQRDSTAPRNVDAEEDEGCKGNSMLRTLVDEMQELKHDCVASAFGANGVPDCKLIRSGNNPCFAKSVDETGNPNSSNERSKNQMTKAYSTFDRWMKGICEPLLTGSCSATASLTAASTHNSQQWSPMVTRLPVCEIMVPKHSSPVLDCSPDHKNMGELISLNGKKNRNMSVEGMNVSWLRWAACGEGDQMPSKDDVTENGSVSSFVLDESRNIDRRTKFYQDKQLSRTSLTPNRAISTLRRTRTSLFQESDISTTA